MANYPAIEKLIQQKHETEFRDADRARGRADSEERESFKEGMDVRKQRSLESYRDKVLELSERASKIHEMAAQTHMAQVEMQMQAEETALEKTQRQSVQLAGALKAIGKLDPESSFLPFELTRIAAKFPDAVTPSKNGYEKQVIEQMDSLRKVNATHHAAMDRISEAWGVPKILKDDGTVDIDAMRDQRDSNRTKEMTTDTKFAKDLGLGVTGAQETSKGTELRFGADASKGTEITKYDAEGAKIGSEVRKPVVPAAPPGPVGGAAPVVGAIKPTSSTAPSKPPLTDFLPSQ